MAIERLGRNGIKPYKVFVYVLVQDIASAERRVLALRETGANPFAQPYRDFTKESKPAKELIDFARWVNNKAVFKSARTFADYSTSIRGHNRDRMREANG